MESLANKIEMNLREWDIIIVNSSAGKDSQAMLDFLARLATEQGVLDRLHVVHAELEEEWKGTKELVKEQADAYGLPTHYIKRPQGSLLAQVEKRGMWPSSTARYCTSDHKRGQISKVITKLASEHPRPRPRILNCMGIRSSESNARSKKSPFQKDARQSNGRKEVWTWLPIFEWSIEQVWSTIKESGVRHHWAYGAGMPRLSCCFCIFAPRAALIRAGQLNPDMLNQYVELEQKIGHTFRKNQSLLEIKQAVEAGEEPGQLCSWEM